ncbi:uncharacterized protein LOC120351581 [Nilaparvata lugens]|uniref:uncharacterized protein LOC120351581 n=1 Tax=Nilaparvata lugens TaxID=108931 RepID=UPI00193E1B9F|nr:uncharacterized protein LOC120351581 [Nilaparvata lugens]
MLGWQIEEKRQTIKINIGPEIEPMHAKADILEGEVIKQVSEHDTYEEDQPTKNIKTEIASHPAERREEPDDITSQAEDVIHGIEGQPVPLRTGCGEEPDEITRQAEDDIHQIRTPASHIIEPLPPTEDHTPTLSLQEVSIRLKAFNDAYEENRRSKEDPTLLITLGRNAILKAIKNAFEGNIQANEEIIEDVRQVRIACEQGLDLEELEQQLKEAAEESRTVTQQIEEECQTTKINIGPVIEPMHAKAEIIEGEDIKQLSERDTCMEDQPTESINTEVAPHATERREGPDDITSQAEDVIHGMEGQPAPPPAECREEPDDVTRQAEDVRTPASHIIEPLPPTEDHTPTLSLQEVSIRLKAFNDAYEENRRSKEDPTLLITLGRNAILKAIKNAFEGNIQANEEIIEDVRQVRIACEQGLDLEELEQQLKEAAEESRTVTQQIEEECQTTKINIGPVIEPMHAKAEIIEGEDIKQLSERDTCMEDQPTESINTEVAPHATERREGPDDITSQAEDVIHGMEGQPAPPPAECREEPDDVTRQAEDVFKAA